MIRPLKKRLVVEPIDEENPSTILEVVRFLETNTKSSGISGKEYTRGVVLAIGDDCDRDNGARLGDIVRFTKNGGLPVDFDGRELLILSEKDLIGIEVEEGSVH